MTSVVIDANICLALFLPLPYSNAVDKMFKQWGRDETSLLAPVLWEYEIVSGLRRAVFHKIISPDDAHLALQEMDHLQVEVISPSFQLHQQALRISARLEQSRCYDAHYLALAEQLQTVLWTADQRLVNQSKHLGWEWVHWIGE